MIEEPKQYWEQRLSGQFNLRGVGHIGFGQRYNGWLYRRKRQCIDGVFGGQSLQDRAVLDVGCGTGFFVDWYLQRGAQVTGVDITQTSVEHLARKFPDARFHVQDITTSPWQVPADFDIINMWDVTYHITDDIALERAFDNIAQSLRPGGYLLFTDFLGGGRRATLPHFKARGLDLYERMLPGKGLRLEEVQPVYHVLNRRHIPYADNVLGGLYFLLDQFQRGPSRNNISLSVWRRSAPDGRAS